MRALIVEDDPISARLMQAIVSPYAEEVVHVDNGQSAFDKFCNAFDAEERFDVIFLDIMMPQVSGHEALSAIREFEMENGIERSKSTPVIMTTACAESDHLYHAHASGCTDYLTKPISGSKVLQILKRLDLIPQGQDIN